MRILNLDILKKGLPGVSTVIGAFLAEAAIVCLETSGHSPGVILNVSGDYEEQFQVEWTPLEDKSIPNAWKDLKEATEYAATAFALLLVLKLTDYVNFKRAAQTGIADYSLEKIDGEEAHIEITGILSENPNNSITLRMSAKRRQLKNYSHIAILVFIAEFSVPKAKIKWL